MPIIELKKLNIVRTKDLLTNGIPKNLDENISNITNCYTYSLGIFYKGHENLCLNPGFTERLPFWGSSVEELLEKIYIDLKNLNIKFREIELDGNVKLKKNEYLIKIFYAPPNIKQPKGDFHFIRQEPKRGYWFHKVGIEHQPEIIHSTAYPLLLFDPFEPDEINCIAFEDYQYTLKPVIYLAIKEPSKFHEKFKKNTRH